MDRDKSRRISCTKLTEKQVAAAAARHELLYSGRVGGARAVFAFCDLSGLDLSGRNLADADFTGAYLEETNLAGARLDSASFFGASLKRANLAGASLRRADMRGTSLRGANLIGADLYEAEVRYLVENEWALTAEDVLWRRTKRGLHLSREQAATLDEFMRGISRRHVAAAE